MKQVARTMVVAGVMSGTSADGVDVAMVRISSARKHDGVPLLKVLGHASFAYPKQLRAAVLRAMNAEQPTSVAELARLHWRLGEVYADAIEKTAAQLGVKVDLAGVHGQTIYHQALPVAYLGRAVRATWQIGEAAVITERLRVPVVSDFRPADLAAGGQGAPLVPMLDFCMFRSPTKNRVLLNLGGIANLTVIPAQAGLAAVMAFDTGPANMVIDALMQRAFGKPFDRGGKVASRGQALRAIIAKTMHDPYFAAPPPKTCGREQFGAVFAERLRTLCLSAGASDANMIATATELTATSVLDAFRRFCEPHIQHHAPLVRSTELIVAGGGTRNPVLLQRLRAGFEALGIKVLSSDTFGVAPQAKEAVAFALLGWRSWHGQPGNVPAATGACRGVVLGKITCA